MAPRKLHNLTQLQKDFIVEKLHDYINDDDNTFGNQLVYIHKSLLKKVKYNTFDPEKSVKAFHNMIYRKRHILIHHIQDEYSYIPFLETKMIQEIAQLLNQDFITHLENNQDLIEELEEQGIII